MNDNQFVNDSPNVAPTTLREVVHHSAAEHNHLGALEERDAPADPAVLFAAWMVAASTVVREPRAAALATATSGGVPSVRMVIIVEWSGDGLIFHTDRSSQKGVELLENPALSLVMNWSELGRQVRVNGRARPLAPADADAYFAARPRAAQIAVRASYQSAPIGDRAALDDRLAEELQQSEGHDELARPDRWGGFIVVPRAYEFWQQRSDRMHDRLVYERTDDRWRLSRLQP